jgi:hypothetical protein
VLSACLLGGAIILAHPTGFDFRFEMHVAFKRE